MPLEAEAFEQVILDQALTRVQKAQDDFFFKNAHGLFQAGDGGDGVKQLHGSMPWRYGLIKG
ncbi:hypothetical protein D3C80_846950 [compost metagenome]